MATWEDVHNFLNQNYESDMGMGILAGPESFAAVVPNDYGTEVILVMNVSDVLVQFAGFLDPKAVNNIDEVFANLQFFGVKKTSSAVVLQHIALLDSLDAQEITGPLNLMSKEMHTINQAL
jgi:hypothetical protein